MSNWTIYVLLAILLTYWYTIAGFDSAAIFLLLAATDILFWHVLWQEMESFDHWMDTWVQVSNVFSIVGHAFYNNSFENKCTTIIIHYSTYNLYLEFVNTLFGRWVAGNIALGNMICILVGQWHQIIFQYEMSFLDNCWTLHSNWQGQSIEKLEMCLQFVVFL